MWAKSIQRTEVSGVVVATVRLRWRAPLDPDGRRLPYETTIVGGPLNGHQWSASTQEAAMMTHWGMVLAMGGPTPREASG